ncbi:MAG: hypothetical protein JNK19_14735 [Tabrizicola sp.]|nr:hypothetical protein [Tabrizicola sp.]
MIRAALLALALAAPARLGDLLAPTVLPTEGDLKAVRIGGNAAGGVPGSMSETASLFQEETVEVGLTHVDAS